MIVLCDTQRTPEWFAAKRGRVSASDARRVLAGRGTRSRRDYLLKIVYDLEGAPDFADEDVKPWFTDGVYYESYARGWYSWNSDVDIVQTGFVIHDEHSWIGCSPDGLVGDDGLVEFKFRKTLRALRDHGDKGQPLAQIKPQLQTQLLVTGRRWIDYVNYWRDDPNEFEQGLVRRVYRDDAYINETLIPAMIRFWSDVRDMLRARRSGIRRV